MNIKIPLVSILSFVLLNSMAHAADYYVAPNGGTGAGSFSDPWNLSHANSQLKAGDRAILRGGIYMNQFFKPINSGNASSPITYVAREGENPQFRGSGKGAVDMLIDLTDRSYIIVDGISADGEGIFKDSNIKEWVQFRNSHYCEVKNSNLYRSQGWSAFDFDNSSYNKLINNVVDTNGTWDQYAWDGIHDDFGTMFKLRTGSSYNLIEGNSFRRSGHDLGGLKPSAGAYNIIRNNTFDNDWGVYQGTAFAFKEGNIAPGDSVGNRTLEIKGGTYTLVENNIFKNARESVDNSYVSMIKVNGVKAIVRNNLFVNGVSGGISSGTGSSSPKSEYNKIFHNVFHNLGGPVWRLEAFQGSDSPPLNNEFKNNIAYKTHTNPKSSNFDVEVRFERLLTIWNDAFLDNKVVNNCFAYDESLSKQQVFTDTSGKKSLTEMETKYPTFFSNNIQSVPSFVESQPQESISDFMLSSGSECKNAGANLTVTTNSGTGKTIQVMDASYFSDGRGLISGDLIKVGGNSPERITKVNYSTNVITLESSITWSRNDGVNLNFSGPKPNVGFVVDSSSSVVIAETLEPPSNLQLLLR